MEEPQTLVCLGLGLVAGSELSVKRWDVFLYLRRVEVGGEAQGNPSAK